MASRARRSVDGVASNIARYDDQRRTRRIRRDLYASAISARSALNVVSLSPPSSEPASSEPTESAAAEAAAESAAKAAIGKSAAAEAPAPAA